ncbi:hypothetical protein CLF_101894 [Clonorchis sinensis]|uniref:Uncharacterized protein n=1 Tax=Clonorchis sinensis TaxID=79923 RepID=G7Y6T5_CLOSI|nr:hypothetical protein CLF_101894 [Clonorchis sinensis]
MEQKCAVAKYALEERIKDLNLLRKEHESTAEQYEDTQLSNMRIESVNSRNEIRRRKKSLRELEEPGRMIHSVEHDQLKIHCRNALREIQRLETVCAHVKACANRIGSQLASLRDERNHILFKCELITLLISRSWPKILALKRLAGRNSWKTNELLIVHNCGLFKLLLVFAYKMTRLDETGLPLGGPLRFAPTNPFVEEKPSGSVQTLLWKFVIQQAATNISTHYQVAFPNTTDFSSRMLLGDGVEHAKNKETSNLELVVHVDPCYIFAQKMTQKSWNSRYSRVVVAQFIGPSFTSLS